MNRLIVSPHTDDAIFSLGSFMQEWDKVTIVSIFAGVPKDDRGRQKHETLLKEHEKACFSLGVNHIELDFLDDVYATPDIRLITQTISEIILKYDKVYVPIGIHHPDHILTRNIFYTSFKIDGFYADLPYRVLYPNLAETITDRFVFQKQNIRKYNAVKERALLFYSSQLQNNHIQDDLKADEYLYED